MGQDFELVNFTVPRRVCHHVWGRGYKFCEFSSSPDTLACLYEFLSTNWAGCRVAFVGSSTEYGEGDVVVNQDVDALRYIPIEEVSYGPLRYQFKWFSDPDRPRTTPQVNLHDVGNFFLVNETKRRYFIVDVREFGEFAIIAVCWMLADASCFMNGGGKIYISDFYGGLDNPVGISVLTRFLGTWAYDAIRIVGKFPEAREVLKKLQDDTICEDASFAELCQTWKDRKQWWHDEEQKKMSV